MVTIGHRTRAVRSPGDVDFALSEVGYFQAITHSRANTDVAYDTFLLGHAAWFGTPPGQALLHAIRHSRAS